MNFPRFRSFAWLAMALWGSAVYAQAQGKGASAAQAEYARAEQAFQSGDLSRASELYARIIEQQGDQPLAWFRMGLIHHRQQAFRPALHAYDKALENVEVRMDGSEDKETLAQIRFNRAMLLLDAAGADLRSIPPEALSKDMETTRDAVHHHVSSALLSAGSGVQLDPIKKSKSGARARGYVYTAQSKPAAGAPTAASPASVPSSPSRQPHAPPAITVTQPGTR